MSTDTNTSTATGTTFNKGARLPTETPFRCTGCAEPLALSLTDLDGAITSGRVTVGKGPNIAHTDRAQCKNLKASNPHTNSMDADTLRKAIKAANMPLFSRYGVKLSNVGDGYDPSHDYTSAAPVKVKPAPLPQFIADPAPVSPPVSAPMPTPTVKASPAPWIPVSPTPTPVSPPMASPTPTPSPIPAPTPKPAPPVTPTAPPAAPPMTAPTAPVKLAGLPVNYVNAGTMDAMIKAGAVTPITVYVLTTPAGPLFIAPE